MEPLWGLHRRHSPLRKIEGDHQCQLQPLGSSVLECEVGKGGCDTWLLNGILLEHHRWDNGLGANLIWTDHIIYI